MLGQWDLKGIVDPGPQIILIRARIFHFCEVFDYFTYIRVLYETLVYTTYRSSVRLSL